MEIAAVHAIAELARQEASDIVASAYGIKNLSFGPDYVIPKPFDPRLISKIAPAVARAAETSGVATRPIADYEVYAQQLQHFVYHSGSIMRPLFSVAKKAPKNNKRIVYAEGEDERVLRAVQVVLDEGLASPILVGRPSVIDQRIEKFGLRMRADIDFEVVNTESDSRYRDYWQTYHAMADRKGVTEQYAKIEMRRRNTLIGTMMIHKGHADGMICGTFGIYAQHLHYIDQVIGLKNGATTYGAMNALMLPDRQVFLVDTHVNYDPSAEQLAEISIMAAEEMQRLGVVPKAALLSHSNFGTHDDESANKMRQALTLIRERAPWLEIDGEMHGDCALNSSYRHGLMPRSTLTQDANLLVLPSLEAANISYNLLKTAASNNVAVGPILLGTAKPAHILTASSTVRRIVNMTALCVVDACGR
jgi:malate dehydrogenase (oxaloacetate-decarboxylating)(NADP+)